MSENWHQKFRKCSGKISLREVWDMPYRRIYLFVTNSFFVKWLWMHFIRSFYRRVYDFFEHPGLFTRLFHNSELISAHYDPFDWRRIDFIKHYIVDNYAWLSMKTTNAFFTERVNIVSKFNASSYKWQVVNWCIYGIACFHKIREKRERFLVT